MKSFFSFAALALVSVLVSTMGCSAQVSVEDLGAAGAPGGPAASTPTNPITTGTIPPSHTAGTVIVTDENSGYMVPDQANVGTQNVVVRYAIDALGNDANVESHEFHLVATDDGGSVVSLGGYPYFDGWKILDLDTGALLLDGGMMQIMSFAELRVRFQGTLSIPAGEKILVGLTADIFKPSEKIDQQQLLDHQYRASKAPYIEGDILDQSNLVVPASEILEDAPLLGDPMIVVAN